MFTEEELLEQEYIVEAILFMMGDSIPVDTIAVALNTDKDTAKAAAERVVEKYENEYKDRGMKVIRINNKYQMVSNNKYFTNLVAVASRPKKPVLTDAILETLSIIAYKQPITKPEIENIRGVKSDFACNKLLEYGLIEEQGRLDAPGRPIILGTTEEFLLRFGIETTADLPILDADRIAEIENEVEKELTESLGEPVFIERSANKESEASSGELLSEPAVEEESSGERLPEPVAEEASSGALLSEPVNTNADEHYEADAEANKETADDTSNGEHLSEPAAEEASTDALLSEPAETSKGALLSEPAETSTGERLPEPAAEENKNDEQQQIS